MNNPVARAVNAEAHAGDDPAAWDVAGDAWEEAGWLEDASRCHAMAGALRRGVPSMLRSSDQSSGAEKDGNG